MEIDKEQLSEVLDYIDHIRSYDQKQFLHVASISELIWIVLMTYAGIVDYFTFINGDDVLNITSWIFASFAGVLLSIFLFSTKFETSPAQSGISTMSWIMKLLLISLGALWFGLFILSVLGYDVLYLSIVSISVALFHFISRRGQAREIPGGLAKFAYVDAHWVFLTVAGVLMLVLNYSLGTWTSKYFGLFFAFAYSVASVMNIYYNQNPPEWRKLY